MSSILPMPIARQAKEPPKAAFMVQGSLRVLFAIVTLTVAIIIFNIKSLPWLIPEINAWSGFSQQTIVAPMTAEHNHSWNAAFDVQANHEQVLVDLKIKLIAASGVESVSLNAQKQHWLKGIEQKWNNRFALQVSENLILPIQFNTRFTPVQPHHEVLVRAGVANPDQHNWYIDTPPEVIAHEIGHMLGAYDEYPKGALSPVSRLIDNNSLMGTNMQYGLASARHLHLLLDHLKTITGLAEIVIIERGKPNRETEDLL